MSVVITHSQLPRLKNFFKPLNALFVDCDGKAQILHTVLTLSSVQHTVYCGHVKVFDQAIAPHFWVMLPVGEAEYILDYSIHQWSNLQPLGCFLLSEQPNLQYFGQPTKVCLLPEPFFIATQADPRHIATIPYKPISK